MPASCAAGAQLSSATRQTPDGVDINLDFVSDMEENCARILQAPLHVRNREVGCRRHLITGSLKRYVGRQLVLRPVKAQRAANLDVGFALRGHLPFKPVNGKRNLRVGLAFQDLLVHVAIATSIAAIAARRVYLDRAAGRAAGGVEMNHSALQLESAVHRVQRRRQREVDFSLGGIELQGEILREQWRGQREGTKDK